MAWPRGLPSTRQQWLQKTVASIPNGNWGEAGGVFVMDDGSIYVMINNPWDSRLAEEWDHRGLYKITEYGAERISMNWPSYMGHYILEGQPLTGWLPPNAPEWSDGKWYLHQVGLRGSSFWPRYTHDGKHIYMLDAYDGRIYKIDPASGLAEWIAGFPDVWGDAQPPSDNPIGVQARIAQSVSASYADHADLLTYHDGALYWAEYARNWGSTTANNMVWRKCVLTPPYPVSTIWTDLMTPDGAPTDTTITAWGRQINSSTGLPNFCNDDVVLGANNDGAAWGDDGYLYFVVGSGEQFGHGAEFSRINPATGRKETLYYARTAGNPPGNIRDINSNHECCPNGVDYYGTGTSGFDYVPGLGTYYYEGMRIAGNRGNVILNNEYIWTQASQNMFWSGYNMIGDAIAKFNIDKALELAPLRHDRRNPLFDTIANGTAGDENYVRNNYARRPSYWITRDGDRPLFSYVQEDHGYCVSPAYPDTLFFLANALPWSVRGDASSTNLFMVKSLQPPKASKFTLRVKFNGSALKGYANTSEIKREAQTSIQMS